MADRKANEDWIMTPEQVEEKVIELIHRDPFMPFFVEFSDGQSLEISHPRWQSTEVGRFS